MTKANTEINNKVWHMRSEGKTFIAIAKEMGLNVETVRRKYHNELVKKLGVFVGQKGTNGNI